MRNKGSLLKELPVPRSCCTCCLAFNQNLFGAVFLYPIRVYGKYLAD
jgi:hypothetical protein